MSKEDPYIWFFGTLFPWSHERAAHLSWTYPEQMFPRLAESVMRQGLQITPGIWFPHDLSWINKMPSLLKLLTFGKEHPEPLWGIMEEAVLDVMSLCTWTSNCVVYIPDNDMAIDCLKDKVNRLNKEEGISVQFTNEIGDHYVPKVFQMNTGLCSKVDEIERYIVQAWNIVRMLREKAFKSLSRPEKELLKLAQVIKVIESTIQDYSVQAADVLDQSWSSSRYIHSVSALKEEMVLLDTRFGVGSDMNGL